MAKSLKDMTRVGTDARKIAALLREKAPAGHDLAWINPREAALLKASGGSGHIDPQTGIRSYEDDLEAPPESPPVPEDTGFQFGGYEAPISAGGVFPNIPTSGDVGTDIQLSSFPTRGAPDAGYQLSTAAARELIDQQEKADTGAAKPPTGKGLNLGQLGVAGIGALLGARAGRKATAAAGAGAQQMQQLAAPYQQAGQQLQAAAQRGELTPGSQQALQAMQAQMAQGIEARGGVGVAQAQAAIANLRTQLLQQQYDYGLKLSGIGDNIALGAIKTGMEADKYAAQLSQNFYSNLARIAGGALAQ